MKNSIAKLYNDGEKAEEQGRALQEQYGVQYYEPGEQAVYEAPLSNLYYYKSFVGQHKVEAERGDCIFWIDGDKQSVHLVRGPATVDSPILATVIRGYQPEDKSTTMRSGTVLPYVNGCSTKQLFPPERLGDPTLQMLNIPPNSAEQAHHIHSTVRVVYILEGRGISVVGMDQNTVTEELYAGKVCILEPMCPHHFETPFGENLVCIPLHVFSSVQGLEKHHPMFNGTHLMD